MVDHARGQAQHERARLQVRQCRLQPPVRRRDGREHARRGRKRRLDRRVDIAAEYDRAAHVRRHGALHRRHRQKALQQHRLARRGAARPLEREVDRVGILAPDRERQHLRQKQLAQVPLLLAVRHEQAADEQRPPAGVLPDEGRELGACQPGKQVLRVKAAVRRRTERAPALAAAQQHHLIVARTQAREQGGGLRGRIDLLQELFHLPPRTGDRDKLQILRVQNGLILRLAQVQAMAVDELLRHGVDQV